MKRLTITVPDSAWDADAAIWRLPDGQGYVGHLPGEWLTVEDVPDPLPTEPGTVIEATVYGRRNRFALLPDEHGWRRLLVDDDLSVPVYADHEITEWTLLLPGVTP